MHEWSTSDNHSEDSIEFNNSEFVELHQTPPHSVSTTITTPVTTPSPRIFDSDHVHQEDYLPQQDEVQCWTQNTSWRQVLPCLVCKAVSNFTFHWVTPLVTKGFKAPLTQEDLPDLDASRQPHHLSQRFLRAWEKEEKRKRDRQDPDLTPSLWKMLMGLYWKRMSLSGLILVSQYFLLFANSSLMEKFIAFMAVPNAAIWEGVAIIAGLFVSSTVQGIMWHQFLTQAEIVGQDAKTALSVAVYRKCLRLSVMNKGDVVTLVATDVNKVYWAAQTIHHLWGTPILFFGTLYQLYTLLGVSVLAGCIVLLCFAPLNYLISQRFKNLQDTLMQLQEKRMKILSEIFQGILVVKFFGWEWAMKKRVEEVRDQELVGIRKWNYNLASVMFVVTGLATLVSMSTFTAYALLGNRLEASTLFPAIYLFGVIVWPLLDLPWSLTGLAAARTSINRLQRFFAIEELPPLACNAAPVDGQAAIKISQGEFWWPAAPPALNPEGQQEKKEEKKTKKKEGEKEEDEDEGAILLESMDEIEEESDELLEDEEKGKGSVPSALLDINLEIEKGQLVAIVGEVGSGKSALLQSILGELHRSLDTHIEVNGKVAYVAQQAWIQNATVKENILFGRPYDERRYTLTLQACALLPDLAMFPAGDKTEIGERGVNLSGGQKQRVNMARAVYTNADIYLFDDPLSAVDAHVGRWLFDQCIHTVTGDGSILEGKTRILVTHQLQYLPNVDKIIVLEKGRITAFGSYKDLIARGIKFELLDSHATDKGKKGEGEKEKDIKTEELSSSTPSALGKSEMNFGEEGKEEKTAKMDEDTDSNGKIIDEEERYTGTIGWNVYKRYLLSTGGVTILVVLAIICLTVQVVEVLSKLFLALQSSQSEEGEDFDPTYFLSVYLGLGIAYAGLVLIRMFTWFHGAYNASRKLHSEMLNAVLRAPMSFFHSTPHGRILNRFSKDQNSVDQLIPDRMSDYILCTIETVAKVSVVVITTPLFLVFVVPLGVAYWFIQQFYRRTARELSRLDSIASSPVMAHFSETVEGASVIRALSMQPSQIRINEEKVENSLKPFYQNNMVNHWLGTRIQVLSAVIVALSAGLSLASKAFGYEVDPAIVGLSLSYATAITYSLGWMVVTGTSAEAEMSRVERILHYCAIPPEAPVETQAQSEFSDEVADPDWPQSGSLEFQEAVMAYKPTLPPVLKQVSFAIKDKEKIGVCGRTGAGKSSLMLALFRIVELSEGKIIVDGVDIAKIGLHDLRKRIGIIPQDPVLFSGSIRSNLDPLVSKSDKEVWAALKRVNLDTYVSSLPGQLEYLIEENGRNFSVGQRQLLCMARSLLENNKILVMDEATANVDSVSDQLIQKTVREVFKDRTVLTIAHRLGTIIDMDRILVMDGGQVVEFDTPYALLQDKDSFFSRLVENTGSSSAAFLREIALKKHNNHHHNNDTNPITPKLQHKQQQQQLSVVAVEGLYAA